MHLVHIGYPCNRCILSVQQKTIDYLKMDVEDSEWDAMEAMFKTDILQSRVKQFGLEIHLMSHSPSIGDIYRRWRIMKTLEECGFRRWYWHFNHDGARSAYDGRIHSCCYEMVYINTRFLTQLRTTFKQPPHFTSTVAFV